MPGTTAPPSTRTTRSRFSSPAVHATANGSVPEQTFSASQHGDLDERQTPLGGWLEPQVQQKPSYQEAGLMRHGVVENMAPLGTLPKVGVFKKAAPPPPTPEAAPKLPTPIRKIVLKKRPEAGALPKPVIIPITPAAHVVEDDTEEQEESANDESDSSDDRDRTPAAPSTRRRSTTATATNADKEWTPSKAVPSGKGTAKSVNTRRSVSRATPGSVAHSSPSVQQTSASSVSQPADSRREATDKVVESAVDEALKHYRYPTAWALRTLYDENSGSGDFLSMFEDVFTQTADADTLDRFSRLLQQKKREGLKDKQAWYYFVPPTGASRPTPRQPKPAPYASLVKLSRSNQPQYRQLQWHLENPAPKDAAEDGEKRSRSKEQKDAVALSPAPAPAEAPVPTIEEPVTTPSRKRQRTTRSGSAKSSKMDKAGGGSGNGGGKAKLTNSPMTRRQIRASSTSSSSSSLSSARSMTPPDGLENEKNVLDEDEGSELGEGKSSPAAPAAAPAARKGNASGAQQPITRQRLPNTTKKSKKNPSHSHSSSSSTPSPVSPRNKTHKPAPAAKPASANSPRRQTPSTAAGAAFSMPAVVDSPLFGTLPKTKNAPHKPSAATRQQRLKEDRENPAFPSKFGALPENDEKIRLRLKAKHVTDGVSLSESFSRYETHPQQKIVNVLLPGHVGAFDAAEPSKPSRASRTSLATPALHVDGGAGGARSTRSGQKRTYDELADDQVSPTTTLHFPSSVLDASSTAATSRAGTPVLRPAKKARTGLRVKNSPMKKKAGTSAGIPRPSGERTSPAPNGGTAAQDENDDYCASCGGNGELLCCDGCTRAFHLTCVDPPLVNDQMPAEWFCNTCLSARDPTWASNRFGVFGSLMGRLDARNSSAFRLPDEIREYFADVQTGADGEYEDVVVVPKSTRKKKAEEEQVPDFFRLRDADGNAVLCHGCQQAASEDRVIIPCSLCGLFWHLDCVDPPLAVPPVVKNWKCPAHVDDLLNRVPGLLGPAHKFRKIKGAPVIEPVFRRGNVNNGYIEVVLDESEDESGWKEATSYGRTYRLRERGIERDFLSTASGDSKVPKIRKNRKGKIIAPLAAASQHLDNRALEELQAARNLAQLSGQAGGGVQTLIDTLLVEANPEVITLMARANPQHLEGVDNLSKMDQQSLRAMLIHLEAVQSRIRSLLPGQHVEGQPAHDATPAPSTPAEPPAEQQLPTAPTGSNSNTHSPMSDLAAPAAPTTSDENSGKELPSPPATDQPDEKPATMDGTEEIIDEHEIEENGMDLD